MNGPESFISPWKTLAWRWEKYYTPPGRPSREAMRFYKQFAQDATRGLKRHPRGLVLGATPELRDLLTEMKWEAVMIDINLEMIEAMTSLLKKDNPNEIIVRGDWIQNPLRSEYFDVVFGDLVLPNVPWSRQSDLLKNVHRMLRPKGAFVTKVEVVKRDKINRTTEDALLEQYTSMCPYRNRAMELFCALLGAVAWDDRTHVADSNAIRIWMEEFREGEKFVHSNKEAARLLNTIWEMWEPMVKVWGVGTEEELRTLVNELFQLVEVKILSDCKLGFVCEEFPLWYLRKQ